MAVSASTARSAAPRTPIQNTQVGRRDVTATGRFNRDQSLRARTRLGTLPQAKETPSDEGTRVPNNFPQSNNQPRTLQRNPASTQEGASATAEAALSARSLIKMNWWLLSVASFCWFWTMVLGLIGFALIATGNTDVLWGWAKVDSFIPASSIGMFVYLIAMMIFSFGGFLGIGLWLYFVEKKNPLGSPMAMITTFFCLAASMTIILQIFPWIIVWFLLLEFGLVSSQKQ